MEEICLLLTDFQEFLIGYSGMQLYVGIKKNKDGENKVIVHQAGSDLGI